jgi:Fic-DOC domain mobile mystery protein B
VAVKFEYAPGATPINADEATGLLPAHLTLQSELNEYEEANILQAAEWLLGRRRGDPLDQRFIHSVHRRMFDQTWKWAGEARRSDKNIGVRWYEIPVRLSQMLGDVRVQIDHKAFSPTEIAARYHHRLVAIHIFPNGNGRHARIMADLLLMELAGRRFEWGRASLLE